MSPNKSNLQYSSQRPLTVQFFGRDEALADLRSHLLVNEQSVQALFVSGASGVGKSRLVQQALRVASQKGHEEQVLIASAKFNASSSSGGLEAVATCLESMVTSLVGTDSTTTEQVGDRLQAELPVALQDLLKRAFPCTQVLMVSQQQPQSQPEKAAPDAAFSRQGGIMQLQLAIQTLFRVITRHKRVILVLDDLHWCDVNSLQILQAILTDPDAGGHLALVGTYRDQEKNEPLTAFCETVQNHLGEAGYLHVSLTCFDLGQINQMLTQTLESDDSLALARIIYERTNGNIFFVQQLLEHLLREGFLLYNQFTRTWEYDMNHIQEHANVSDNILDVVVQNIQRLDPNVQKLLLLCACVGSKVHVHTLQLCHSALEGLDHLPELLESACHDHVLHNLGAGWFKFSHDKVLESVQSMLPTGEERNRLHWDIGKLLWKTVSNATETEDHLVFMCANQVIQGVSCASAEDQNDVARLCLRAARLASKVSAFHPAKRFCQAGVAVLKNPLEQGSSSLCLDLNVHLAEMLYCVGDMADSRSVCSHVLTSKSLEHKIPCYLTMIQILLSEAKNEEVVTVSLEALKMLGVQFPSKPGKIDALVDYQKTAKVLKHMSEEHVLELPMMADSHKATCIQIMQEMTIPLVHLEGVHLTTLLVGKMVRMTFKYGLTPQTPLAFAIAGVYLIAFRDAVDDGYKLGKLAISLIEKVKADTERSKITFWTTVFTQYWKEPISPVLEVCIEGYRSGMSYGHIHYAFHGINCYGLAYFYGGLPLKPLVSDFDRYAKQMLTYGQDMVLLCLLPMWQCTLNLCGLSDNPLDMTSGYAMDKQNIVGNDQRVGEQACWSFQMQLCFYFGEQEQAHILSEKIQALTIGLTRAEIFYPTRVFFFALVAIEQYRLKGKRKHLQEAKKHVGQVTKWIQEGAINLVHKGLILQAEMGSLTESDHQGVRRKYDNAFSSSMRTGFLQDAALCCQLAAGFCDKHLPTYTEDYLAQAWEQWKAWNAVAVAKHMEKRFPVALSSRSSEESLTFDSIQDGNGFRSRSRFDDSFAKQHENLES